MANLLSTIVDGQITVNSGRLLLQTGGVNTYGIISGYNNNNHFITMRGSVSGSTTSPTLSGVHQMTFVEYAEANDSTGWYFKSSSSGTYEEIARITRSGINWNGNTVIHSGNIGSYALTSYGETDTLSSVTGRGATTASQVSFTKTDDHAISVGTIRGRAVGSQTGEFIQLYERVNIGGPNGWGAANTSAPTYGLSVYGGATIGYGNSGGLAVTGTLSATNFSGSSSGTNTGDQTNISGYSGSVNIPDWRNTSYTPAQYDGNRVNWHFNNTDYNDGPPGDYWGAMQTVSPWSAFNISHRQSQLWWGGSVGLSYRYAVGSGYTPTGWSAWEKIITSGSIGSQSVSYATNAGALSSMNISQFTNNSGYITSVPNLQYGGGDSLTGAGTATTWDPRGTTYDRYVIGNHTGISLHGYPGYGGVRLYAAGYPTLTTSVLRLEASDAVYTFGGLYSDGNAVIHAGNIGSQSVADASTLGGYGRGNTTNKVAYFDGSRNLYVNNPETYTGEVRLGAAWGRGGVYASGTLSLSTSGTQTHFVFGNSVPIIAYSTGQIDLGGSSTEPINITGASHKYITINPGNGYEAMVRYIGGSGSSWYVGKRVTSQVVGTESFHFYSEAASQTVGGIDTGGNMIVTGSMRAPIFYDSNNTGYYGDFASTSVMNAIRFGTSTNNGTIYGADTWGVRVQTDSGYIWLGPANGGHAHIYTDRANFYFNAPLTVNGGSIINTDDIRASIFYDLNDTGYYGNFASLSRINEIGANKMRADTNGDFSVDKGWWSHDPYGYGWGKPHGSFRTLEVSSSGNFDTEPAMFRIHQWGSGSAEFWKPKGTTLYLRETPGGSSSWFTRFEVQGSTYVTSSMQAYSYQGHSNVAGTGNASYHPSGIYSTGTNWLYGTMYMNDNSIRDVKEVYNNGWFRTVGHQGLHNPTNDAHFYPNNASYGSWRIDGTRGGWHGLHFSSGSTLMMNGAETGIHREGYGWQFRWYNGSMLVSRGTYGGGTEYTVIDSGTIGSQSVSYAASAGGVSWGNVSSKPAGWLDTTNLIQGRAPDSILQSGFYESYLGSGNPTGTWFNYINVRHSNPDNGHGYQIGMSYYDNNLWFRSYQGAIAATFQAWSRALGTNTDPYPSNMDQYVRTSDSVSFLGTTSPTILVNGHSDNTKGYRIHNTSGSSVSAMFTNSSNQLVIAAGAVDQINLNKKVYVNGVALGVNIAPSATAGRIDASNDIVAYSSSDERLKQNITPIANALDKVKSLTGVEFDWKPEYKEAHGHEGHDTGIIAQQVLGVMPTAVRTNDTGYLAVRYEKLIGLLIEANKELAARVEELEKKIG